MSLIRQDSKFLLVDDFEMARKILRESLKRLGYHSVQEASDGKTALALLRQAAREGSPFRFVFCAAKMGEMTGADLLRACKDDPVLCNTPFVMVGTEHQHDIVNQSLGLGALDYIIKPFSTKTIQAKIQKVTDNLLERPAA